MSTRAVILAAALALVMAGPSAANDLDRDREPVVLEGSVLADLQGTDPGRVVAFRYDEGWIQIPVQIDERDVVDFGTIYNTDPTGYTVLTYTDTSVFTGPDSDPIFDADDELVVMAIDAGGEALALAEPPGAVPGTGLELTLTHPVTSATAYVYLFASDGTLDPANGEERVAYSFGLLSGPYKTTYGTMAGPNPEDSDVVSPFYAVHFYDRWLRDETSVSMGGSTGADILDEHKNQFAPGNCGRTCRTFSTGEGAFIVNRTGPLRTLRGYVGANSGPTTHRIHAFYEEREDILTVLRVHAISGVIDFFDYSPEADGMSYHNDLSPAGVTIDGIPDAVVPGAIVWEMVTGAQGTLAHAHSITTDIPGFSYTSYYCDDATPPEVQCTGDAYEYGASGIWVQDGIPNTDPGVGPYYIFESHRRIAYGAPDQVSGFAEAFAAEVAQPLLVDVEPYDPSTFVDGGLVDDSSRLALAVGPSPARGLVGVHLALLSRGRVSVDLHDVAGRLVSSVFDGVLPAGDYTFEHDVTGLVPGVYFVRACGPDGTGDAGSFVVLR
jgi:hypothetical protein